MPTVLKSSQVGGGKEKSLFAFCKQAEIELSPLAFFFNESQTFFF